MEIVGVVSDRVISLLGISPADDKNIYFGHTNRMHMMSDHPDDFKAYGDKIGEILSSPDYLRLNDKDGSIEYVKEFSVNGEFVKVAVRLSAGDKYYARTLYVLNPGRVQRFIQNGKLKQFS